MAQFGGWSPDDKQLMVTTRIGQAPESTYIVNADGSNRRAVFDGMGQWLRDGRVVQMTRSMTGSQILVRDGPASAPRPLTSEGRFQFMMVPTPDGRRIVVQAGALPQQLGGGTVYIMNRDGTGMRKLIDDAAHIFNLGISPDGTRIVFEDTRDKNTDIYVMDIDGSGERRLTTAPEADAQPRWSPDGKLILFTSGFHVWLMNADGSERRQLH